MKTVAYVPHSLRSAGRDLRISFRAPLEELSHDQFVRVWSVVAYLFPSLHPDGYEDCESGWPKPLKRFADEALRRFENEELADEEFYCADAQWSGIYDRMCSHTADEMERRLALAADYGDSLDA